MNDLPDPIASLLPGVARPSRYIDGEFNCAPVDLAGADVSVCLVYPDTYEVGMSNLGMTILYDILACMDGVAVDRAFAPWPDMEAGLRQAGLPLFGLASQAPLGAFDVLGVTLQYEMTYTNILTVLDLAGIPARSAERGPSDPLVLGGGPCAVNPEPVAAFFDAILVGDGEEAVVEIADALRRAKQARATRQEMLAELAMIEGVYVPAFYEPSYKADGSIAGVAPVQAGVPSTVRRRILSDLNKAEAASKPLVPFADVVHDRLALEVMRGCTRGCRFCQAGMTYRPFRERDPAEVVSAAVRLLSATGYEDLSLVSLSSTDYSQVSQVVERLCGMLQGTGVALSLPSGRVDAFSVDLARSIARLKKTGLTFAPEAGSQRLRNVINKQVTQTDFERTISEAFRSGWKRVKLYFMVGLPSETRADVEGIGDMIDAGARVARECGGVGGPLFNVSVSCMVPKAQSPFQWAGQDSLEMLGEKQELLRKRLSRRVVKLAWHDPELSVVEGVMARGDRRLADVIETAWRSGCRFDAWSEHFRFDLWTAALAAHDLSADFYTHRRRSDDEIFPWEHIAAGPAREFLLEEWHKALDGITTGDCRTEGCTGCGICGDGVDNVQASTLGPGSPAPRATEGGELHRLRIRYSKIGRLRFLSHLEVAHAIERGARRAALPVAVSGGFSPKTRISYGPALHVGAAGLAEYADLLFVEGLDAEEVSARLDEALPPGLDVTAAVYVDRTAPSLSATLDVAAYEVSVVAENPDAAGLIAAIRDILAAGQLEVLRKGGVVVVDLPMVARHVEMPQNRDGVIEQRVWLYLGRQQHLRPEALLCDALKRVAMRHQPAVVVRTGLFTERGDELVDPMEVDT